MELLRYRDYKIKLKKDLENNRSTNIVKLYNITRKKEGIKCNISDKNVFEGVIHSSYKLYCNKFFSKLYRASDLIERGWTKYKIRNKLPVSFTTPSMYRSNGRCTRYFKKTVVWAKEKELEIQLQNK